MSRKWQCLLGILLTVLLVVGAGLAPAAFASSHKANYKFKWRMPQTMPVGDDHDLRAQAFAKEVKEKTDGRIDITVYSGGVLCDWVECYENVMRGDIEIALSSFPDTFDPRMVITYYMPYLFTTTEEAKKAFATDGWYYKLVDKLLLQNGIKGLAIWPQGWAGMTAREEPKGWREMKPNGMKLRVMPLKACELTWQRLGYIPVTIPYNDAFSAISRGVADGQSGGPPYQGYQFREVQKVWLQYNDYLEPWWFFINLDLWNKLTEHDQNVLIDAAQKQCQGRWDFFLKEADEFSKKMADFGLKVIQPTDAELKSFADAVRKDVWPKLEPLMGKTLVDECRKNVGIPVQ
jgi:TRAP-type C4-dicarboxylate transport system substrate-binding protein